MISPLLKTRSEENLLIGLCKDQPARPVLIENGVDLLKRPCLGKLTSRQQT